ncbi:MAG: hypothetical protein A3H98_11055 [Bacteroidetes bacterium RIFCSPLOWO2_02_FULL_36_8]|nr:MAG: hypothetical protein A3H98_11055 [Bacteroidetes bacterium RIFCSPLOWO2_02_FULL_36_8]OFY70602.1 MAG: hypothetical protein A3G23_07675 [Bacteroidetes bacterium RIFCSPLOWO2_12_FULL_37_12]
MRNKIIISFLILSIAGCKKEENKEFTDSPIIESYLSPGDYLNIKVTRQIPFSSDVSYSSDDINHLTINVTRNNVNYTLQALGDGKYVDGSLIVAENDLYDLSFSFNSKNVSAYTKVPAKPQNFTESVTEIELEKIDTASGPPNFGSQLDPVNLTWDNTDGSYYLVLIENIETTLEPIRDFGGNAPPGNRFRKSPTNASSTEIRSMEFQYFGSHRIVLYHVLPDYASLYDDNSTSSQNLTNPSTSIVNGYGIFTGLNSDTLYLEVKKK